jgi:ABC-type antimicrobial peptide transport system permease subunit
MLEPPESGRFELGEDVLLAEREHRRDVIAALPGIDAVAFGTLLPGMARNTLMMQLAPPDDPEDRFAVSMHAADSAYFDVLEVSLRDGRLPEANDRDVVINATLARRLWGRTNVAGEVIPRNPPPGANAPQWTVLGVIDDIAYGHPSDEPEPLIYAISNSAAAFESILIKSSASIADIQRTLQGKIDDGELAIRINSIQSIEALADRVLAADRARTMLTVAAAALVVLLAGFGFFGTQRFLVAAGRREYAILAALGAGPRALGRLVLRRGLLQGVPGLVLGSILAFIVVAWMRDDFFSTAVSPSAVTALVAIGIAVLLLGATIGPASQARNTEPAPLLREE